MERLLQYMDDLDDLYGALGLVYEKLRHVFLKILSLCAGLAIVGAGIVLALVHPPIALATCIMLFVTLLYRSATAPARSPAESV